MPASPARKVAYRCVMRVVEEGAWASRLLPTLAARASLSPEDRALATELSLGALRRWWSLGEAIRPSLKRQRWEGLEPPVAAALAIGAYELYFARTPARAALHEAVELVKETRPRASGFVNAILRKVAKAAEAGEKPQPRLPPWLFSALRRDGRSDEDIKAWAEAQLERAPTDLRVRLRGESLERWLEQMRSSGFDLEALGEGAYRVVAGGKGDVPSWPGFDEGHWSVQDLAAQCVGHMAWDGATKSYLDLCAAPGGKILHLAEAMDAAGAGRAGLFATELHPHRLKLLEDAAARLGFDGVRTATLDARKVKSIRKRLGREHFDVVVLDAPCTGTGTLRRHPESLLQPSRLEDLLKLQRELLKAAVELTAPGGLLLYAVCSVLREEGEGQVASLLEGREFVAEGLEHPERLGSGQCALHAAGKQKNAAFAPWLESPTMDGFYAIRLRRLG